jgi:alkanesulfonate monooxygenase SsuD/methylene tetrahydromethanopterin reductase-like flavin-dependent oxidoreductase (luciferase family)
MTTFGLHLTDFSAPQFAGHRLLDAVTEIASALDRDPAFTTLWVTDHLQNLGPAGPSAPMPEAYSLLNAVAARTSSLQLGVLATSVLYRRPTMLAKLVSTLDALSNGRAILGIGAGHPRTEAEHRAYGYEFPSVGQRMNLLESALATIRPMIAATATPASPPNSPRPARPAGIPVLVAGSGEQRLLRIAARHADMINLSFPSGDTLDRIAHKRDVLAAHCATVGRGPAEITITYKAVLSVAETSTRAHAVWDEWRAGRGIPDLNSRAGVFVGSSAEVAAQFEPWLRAGIDHFVLELPHTDPASVALAGATLAGLRTPAGVSGAW